MVDACCEPSPELLQARHRGALWAVLAINLALFGVELVAGVRLGSSALLGDSLDMLGDAVVYAASLYVVGRSEVAQARVALGKASLMAALGAAVLADAALRATGASVPPSGAVSAVGALALTGNAACFAILYRLRGDNLNLRSTWLCSRNDLIANLAVIASAGVVALVGRPWPDALVGGGLALLWLRTSARVLREAWGAARPGSVSPNREGVR